MSKAAFIGLRGIKASWLKRKVLNFSSDLAENRGKHDNHSKVAVSVKNCICKHTEMFPARENITVVQKMNPNNTLIRH